MFIIYVCIDNINKGKSNTFLLNLALIYLKFEINLKNVLYIQDWYVHFISIFLHGFMTCINEVVNYSWYNKLCMDTSWIEESISVNSEALYQRLLLYEDIRNQSNIDEVLNNWWVHITIDEFI